MIFKFWLGCFCFICQNQDFGWFVVFFVLVYWCFQQFVVLVVGYKCDDEYWWQIVWLDYVFVVFFDQVVIGQIFQYFFQMNVGFVNDFEMMGDFLFVCLVWIIGDKGKNVFVRGYFIWYFGVFVIVVFVCIDLFGV